MKGIRLNYILIVNMNKEIPLAYIVNKRFKSLKDVLEGVESVVRKLINRISIISNVELNKEDPNDPSIVITITVLN